MNIQSLNHLKNTFLISMPSMAETWFSQSLTVICEHSSESTMGIVINKPLGMQLGELYEQMDIPCDDMNIRGMPVFKGGPVQNERGFVLHTGYGDCSGAQVISENLYLSTSKDVLVDIALGKGPEKFLVALGYAGWGANQLAEEIQHNAWLNGIVAHDIIFELPTHYRWEEAARRMGVEIKHLSSLVGHA
jgi:putative transcriptional regulator